MLHYVIGFFLSTLLCLYLSFAHGPVIAVTFSYMWIFILWFKEQLRRKRLSPLEHIRGFYQPYLWDDVGARYQDLMKEIKEKGITFYDREEERTRNYKDSER